MKFFFLLPAILVGSLLAAQPMLCPISDSLYNVLDGQARQILLNEMVANRTATENPVEFDSVRLTEYIALLYAVHELSSSPERDLVIDELNIQPFPVISPHIVRLAADPDQGWMVNLRNELPSGNNILDSLMAEYDLEVSRFLLLSSFHVVDLVSPRFFNTPALAEVFEATMDSLNFAEPRSLIGDGDNIEMIPVFPNGLAVRYSTGDGDCPAGCIFRINYDFVVDPVCTEFEIFARGSTSTRRAPVVPLIVFPVPFTGTLHLPATLTGYEYTLFDAVGRCVKASAMEQNGPIVGLEGLTPGWYLLKVQDRDGKIHVARVIK